MKGGGEELTLPEIGVVSGTVGVVAPLSSAISDIAHDIEEVNYAVESIAENLDIEAEGDHSSAELKPSTVDILGININAHLLERTAFSLSATNIGVGGSIAIVDSFVQAYNHAEFIDDAALHLKNAVRNVTYAEVAAYKHKTAKTEQESSITEDDIIGCCRASLAEQLSKSIIKVGARSTVAFASTTFAIGLLMPPAFIVTAPLAATILAVGAVSTMVANYARKKQLNNNIDNIIKSGSAVQELAQEKLKDSNRGLTGADKQHNSSDMESVLTFSTLFFKASKMAGAFASILSKVSTICIAVVIGVKSAFDSIGNYQNRQRYLQDENKLADLVSHVTMPDIFKKKYFIFGQTKFSQFLQDNPQEGELAGKSAREIRDHHPKEFAKLVNECTNQHLQLEMQAFAKKSGIKITHSEFNKHFIESKLGKYISKDVWLCGATNSLQIGGAIASLAAIPLLLPLAPVLLTAGLGVAIGGAAVTGVVAHQEVRAFITATDKILDSSNPNITNLLKIMQNIQLPPVVQPALSLPEKTMHTPPVPVTSVEIGKTIVEALKSAGTVEAPLVLIDTKPPPAQDIGEAKFL